MREDKKWIALNNEVMSKDDNGWFNLEADKEAVKSFFIDNINKNLVSFLTLKEKVDYMIENNYWFDILAHYEFDDVKQLFEHVYNKKFRFKSYMAASKFYQTYALKDDKDSTKFLERYEDRICCASLFLGIGLPFQKVIDIADTIINQEYQPATPTFLNAGRKRSGQLVSCFLDEIGDSLSGIAYAGESAMKLSAAGGGVAFNLSKLRGRGEAIKGVPGRASGVLPVMKIFEDKFSYANQLGQREGAGAVYLNVFHSDISEFLDCKKINVDEKLRIKTLSTGVIIPKKFFEIARDNKPFFVFGAHSVFQAYGKYLDDIDMDVMYDELVDNPKVIKTRLNAREIILKIATSQKESGYPYVFDKHNANKDHALHNLGNVNFSNLCTEIMQVSQVSNIEDRGSLEPSEYNYGISCNLGSLNIREVMARKSIEKTVRTAVRTLVRVTDVTDIEQVPSIRKANKELRSIGLGAMNLHGYLANVGVKYDSEEGREFADVFFMLMNYYSLKESNDIAVERCQSFYGFENSDYGTGEYFKKYLPKLSYGESGDFSFTSEKVKGLFTGIDIPTIKEWHELSFNIASKGLYNSYRLAIAPNQSTSYIMNATASIMPIVDKIEIREYKDSKTYYPMPDLSIKNFNFYKSAYDMDQLDVLKMVGVIQKHVDQGISCILHTTSEHTTRDIGMLYLHAHVLGLKSLYYTRTRKSTIDDCISCSA